MANGNMMVGNCSARIHYVDLLCYFFEKPLKAISSTRNVSNKLQAEDTHIGMIKFKDVTCTIGLSTAYPDFKASIDIICQNKIMLNWYSL